MGVISSSVRISMTVGIRGESPRTVRFWIWNPEELHLWGIRSVSHSRPLSLSLSASAPGVLGCDLTMRLALTIDDNHLVLLLLVFFLPVGNDEPYRTRTRTKHDYHNHSSSSDQTKILTGAGQTADEILRAREPIPYPILILVLVPTKWLHSISKTS